MGSLRGPTWEGGAVLRGRVPFVRAYVKNLVDEFINAWLSVNPKK